MGITTHQWHLQKGLDIGVKARRVENYVRSLLHDHQELLASMGKKSILGLNEDNIYWRKREDREMQTATGHGGYGGQGGHEGQGDRREVGDAQRDVLQRVGS